MKRAFLAAIIVLIIGTTAFALEIGNINPIQKLKVSSEAKHAIEQPTEIIPELNPVINSEAKQIGDISKEIAVKPVIITKVELVTDPQKVTAKRS